MGSANSAMAKATDAVKALPGVRYIVSTLSSPQENKALQNVSAEVQEVMDSSEKTTLSIAITGITGAGKSSLVNALRGMADDDEGAAPTGVVETTMKPTEYPCPQFSSVVLWDLPGIGTHDFKPNEYLQKVNFSKYDFFLIVSSDRFTDNDANLAREIQKMKKKFYFVRSKIDVDLRNECQKRDYREEKTLEKIRNYCYQHLKQPRVFLISRWDLNKYDFPLLQMTLKEELDFSENNTLNVAITGVVGSGKSSLVNALQGLDDDDDNAAKTDVVQRTRHPESYPHPEWPNITLWDLPGIGSTEFQLERYLQQVHFDKYDMFIIVSCTRFTENDAKLAQEIQKKKKKFYFVRSKIDFDLGNECRKRDFREEKTLEKIRNDCYQHLKQPRVFLISTRDVEKYDFPLLQMCLEEELDDLKGQHLILAMPAFSREVLKKKKEAVKKVLLMQALRSSVLKACPVPGLSFPCNTEIMERTLKLFCNVFGLDNVAIAKLAQRFGKDEAILRSAIKKSPMASEITPQLVTELLKESSVCERPVEDELVQEFKPVLLSKTSGNLSFTYTYHMLSSFLNNTVEDAENLLAKISE